MEKVYILHLFRNLAYNHLDGNKRGIYQIDFWLAF